MARKGKSFAAMRRQLNELRAALRAAEKHADSPNHKARPSHAAENAASAAAAPEILRHLAEAEAASRAKDHFLAELSHEIRTPLSPALMAASELELRQDIPADVRDQAAMIRRNLELAARLVNDLLDLTRIARGKLSIELQTLDLCRALRETVEMCAAEVAAKDLHLTVDVKPGNHFVRGDLVRLEQVFTNLLKNAIKFTPTGGTITVRCFQKDNRAVVEVADSGAGIDPQVIPHIFEPFWQGGPDITRHHGGMGLGLAISQSLIHLHQGAISAHSDGVGKGALFRIELPAVSAPAHGDAPACPPPPAPPEKLRILLVEDHPDTARTMSHLLTLFGHSIRTADSVAAARELAAQHPFDLVLADLGLPDGSGLDLMRDLAREHLLQGIAVTGYGMEQDLERSRQAGFLDHIVKPINVQRLEAVIRSASEKVLAPRSAPGPACSACK